MLHVHLARNLAADAGAVLRQALPPSVRITAAPEEPQPVDCHILVTGVVSHEEIRHSPDLRAVIVPFAGPPAATMAVLRDYPAISLHNLHFNDSATAEFTLALLLATAKWLMPADRLLRHGDWTYRGGEAPTALLWGKRVTILGYGAIGRRLAPVCRALGMQVVGVKRTVNETRDGAAEGMADGLGTTLYTIERLHAVLPQTDLLLCVLPETPETVGLVGERELALLPRHAIVVNTGRGPVIDEAALFQALSNQTIKAAGLDVWYQYPASAEARTATFPSRFPFHELENVVLSPHRGGWIDPAEHVREQALAVLLRQAAEGLPMANVVNKTLGY
jgi:phosphoglycerate dehydrogenase-like enzyme